MLKGNGPEFRFRIIVGLLFAAIIILILATSYLYKREKILDAINDRVFFWKEKRRFDLLDGSGRDLVSRINSADH